MRKYIILSILFVIQLSNLFGHGLAVHVSQYEKIKQYYLNKYGSDNDYYKVMNAHPNYVKYGMMLPDMVYVNAGKVALEKLYEIPGGLRYEITTNEVPDPSDPDIGTLSWGIDSHDYRYAMQFAEYLLNQANLPDPPGVDPGDGIVSRNQKLALAIGYYAHMVQDIIAHNFWVPKLTAESGLGELSLIEPHETETQLDVIPGIQAHYAIETMHDYRLGSNVCQQVADIVYDGVWITVGIGEPNYTTLDRDLEYGVTDSQLGMGNPSLDFFHKVLEDWYNNNPMGLITYKNENTPLISLNGFFQEATMWRFIGRFFPQVVGHGDFASTLANWLVNHSDLTTNAATSWVDVFTANSYSRFLYDKIVPGLKPYLQKGFSEVFQTYVGFMNNDPQNAENMAQDIDLHINYDEYLRLKSNPVFTDPSYFDGFNYYENLELEYFDQVGPGGKIYSDWAPEYFYSYQWGVYNALNADDQFDRRSDIGVYDAWFTVNGQRYGPGVDAPEFGSNSFTANAEFYAFKQMTSAITITAKLKLDHINNASVYDPVIKTATYTMQQDPADYNTIDRKIIEVPFSSSDMAGFTLSDYKGVYLELSIITNKPFYTTDWEPYANLTATNNRRFNEYDTYNHAPYSYPNGYIYLKFTNINKNGTNIGGTVQVNGETKDSDEIVPIFHNADVDAVAQDRVIYQANGINYKHHDWNESDGDFRLAFSFNAASTTKRFNNLNFRDPIDITFNSQGGDVGAIQINDPWYVEKSGINEGKRLDRYHSLDEDPAFNGSDYEVFEGLLYNTGKKHYTLKTETHDYNTTRWNFYGWSSDGATLQEWENQTSAIVFNQHNASITAHYKGHLRSNLSNAYSSNSQRKHVRTDDGKYHTVYVSDYYDIENDATFPAIFYSKSGTSDFNSDWQPDILFPGTAYWDPGIEMANPSIDYLDNKIYLTYEMLVDGYAYIDVIEYDPGSGSAGSLLGTAVQCSSSYFGSIKPVIAVTDNEVFVAWKESAGSNIKYKVWSFINGLWLSDPTNYIPNTTSSSANVTVAGSKNNGTSYSKIVIAWQHGTFRVRYIRYQRTLTQNPTWSDYSTVSTGSGFSINEFPSISLPKYNTSYIEPVLSWRGRNYSGGIWTESAVVRPRGSGSWGSFYQTGNKVDNTTINSANSGESIILTNLDTGQESKWIRRDAAGTYYTAALSDNGIYSQPSNSSNLNTMAGLVYKKDALPHKLLKISTDFTSGGMSKSGTISSALMESRQGVVKLDSAEIVFKLSDILLNDRNVSFIGISDTIPVKSLDQLNSLLRTEDFFLDNNSTLFFSESYHSVFDSTDKHPVQGNNSVKFTVELVRANDGYVAGTVDSKKFDKSNITDQANTDYQLNCSGISAGEYYLRLVAKVDGDAGYFLVNGHNGVDDLAKKSYRDLSVAGISIPLSYNLYQNHPNPFNPTTTIGYEIPKDNHVTIYVYDVLGREVAKLVDGFKKAGQYSVIFDAKDIAAGLYLYRLSAGEHISQKKMLLIK